MSTRTLGGIALLLLLGTTAAFVLWQPGGGRERRRDDRQAEAASPSAAADLRRDGIEILTPPPSAREIEPPGETPSEPRTAQSAFVLTVVDATGSALSGARAMFEATGWNAERKTDDRGRCSVELPETTGVRLTVECDGYAHLRVRIASRALTLVLQRSARLEGRVLDRATRQPIEGAVVERVHTGCAGCPADRIRTGSDGRFQFAGLPAGAESTLSFFVRAAGYAGERVQFVLREAEETASRDFALDPRPELFGKLVDFVSGAPIAGARLAVGVDVLTTDANGSFSTTSTAALDAPSETRRDERWLTASAEGHARLSLPIEELAVPALLRLPRAATLVGRVLDPDGAPVSGAFLHPSNRWDYGDESQSGTPYADLAPKCRVQDASSEATSDADGRYRLPGLVPWCDAHVVWVGCEGFLSREIELPTQLPSQELALDIVLERPGTGTIHGELLLNGRASRGSISWDAGDQSSAMNGSVEVEDGRFRIEHLPAGHVRLRALPLGQDVVEHVPEAQVELELAAGAELRHDFRLELPLSPVRGRVTYDDGSPAKGIEMLATEKRPAGTPGSSLSSRAQTNERGEYRLIVPDGAASLVVTARQDNTVQRRTDVRPGSTDVDFVLPQLGSLLFRVLDRDSGEEVRPIGTSWRRAGQGEYAWFTWKPADEQGFLLARLPCGSVDFSLFAGHAGYRSALRLDVPVRADGEPERVTFELERGLSVTFQLDPPTRPPGSHWTVLSPAELWSALTCTRNENGNNLLSFGGAHPANGLEGLFQSQDGRSMLRGLAPGRYRFKVFHEALALDPEEIELTESPAEPIVVRWSRR